MKKIMEYLSVALYAAVVVLLGILENRMQVSETVKILLWLLFGIGLGFILPIIHSKTRFFPQFALSTAVIIAVCVAVSAIHSHITVLRVAENVILFASSALGWFLWNKAGCPSRKKLDIDA